MKGADAFKELEDNHRIAVDVDLEIVRFMPKDLRGHIAIGARLPSHLEGRKVGVKHLVPLVVLKLSQGFAQAEICVVRWGKKDEI